MSDWHLAQINIGRMRGDKGDPQVQEFYDALDAINALADAAPGFVWRLQDEAGDATSFQPTPDPRLLLNMSVWESAEALFEFVYRSAHTPVMAQRRNWFERYDGVYQALWWIEAGYIPTIYEGYAHLWMIERFGPTPHAFTFKTQFPHPEAGGVPRDWNPDPWCVGNA